MAGGEKLLNEDKNYAGFPMILGQKIDLYTPFQIWKGVLSSGQSSTLKIWYAQGCLDLSNQSVLPACAWSQHWASLVVLHLQLT